MGVGMAKSIKSTKQLSVSCWTGIRAREWLSGTVGCGITDGYPGNGTVVPQTTISITIPLPSMSNTSSLALPIAIAHVGLHQP